MAPKSKNIVDISGLFKSNKAFEVSAQKKSRRHPERPKFEHALAQQFCRLLSPELILSSTDTLARCRKH